MHLKEVPSTQKKAVLEQKKVQGTARRMKKNVEQFLPEGWVACILHSVEESIYGGYSAMQNNEQHENKMNTQVYCILKYTSIKCIFKYCK